MKNRVTPGVMVVGILAIILCIMVAILVVMVITDPSAAKEAKDMLEKAPPNPW
jgi:hypothetical protein